MVRRARAVLWLTVLQSCLVGWCVWVALASRQMNLTIRSESGQALQCRGGMEGGIHLAALESGQGLAIQPVPSATLSIPRPTRSHPQGRAHAFHRGRALRRADRGRARGDGGDAATLEQARSLVRKGKAKRRPGADKADGKGDAAQQTA
jgi:hypothetical protein